MINYFVFYISLNKHGDLTYTNCVYKTNKKITDYDDILNMEKDIQQKRNLFSLPITVNFKELPND